MANEDLLVQFGQKVKQLRKARGLSQEQLSFAAELERSYISDIEVGRRNVALRNVYALATALGMTLAQLFEGIE
jgi:transcriptional regulator with XRE-family HTH domain